ncbi:MAG: carbon storage regulator [Bryobacteraceae bacterium]
MLVIRRRAGDSFLIGDNIEIEILEMGATQVKIGIRAPKEVPVVRKEVSLTRHANRAASRDFDADAIGELLRKRQP